MMEKKLLLLLIINSIVSAQLNTNPPSQPTVPYQLQTQCQGLQPVYDDRGNLIGQRGICDIDRFNGQASAINSMHPVDTRSMGINVFPPPPVASANPSTTGSSSWFGGLFGQTLVAHPEKGSVKFEQPPDIGLFDWLSPHHDLIRNRPEYRHAHIEHRHCIHKKREGLFDFIGKLFGSGSQASHNDHYLNDINDPYSHDSRCLNSQYYKNNPFLQSTDQYDPYSMHFGKSIHLLRNQIDDPTYTGNLDSLRSRLHDHYDRLHRHLDCHCHHELPQSAMYNIHHRPISRHSMRMIANPDPSYNSHFPLHMHSSMPLDHSMDMEDEHMALMRLSGYAAQHAYNSGHFNSDSMNPLRMQMFHPVNQYAGTSIGGAYDDPEWNRLRVEKVIVIKRIKIPVVRNVSVPVPVAVPVPYPIMTPSPDAGTDSMLMNQSSAQSSMFSSAQPGYMGDNTYLVDSGSSPMQMDNLVHAISGAPCDCMNTAMMGSGIMNTGHVNPMINSYPMNPFMNTYSSMMGYNQSGYNPMMEQQYNNQIYQDPSFYNPMPQMSFPNMMTAQTMMQPGLQVSPSPVPIYGMDDYMYDRYGRSRYPRRESFFDQLRHGIRYHAANRIANGLVNGAANMSNPNMPPPPQQPQQPQIYLQQPSYNPIQNNQPPPNQMIQAPSVAQQQNNAGQAPQFRPR